jgi:hypothetical protein
MSEDAELPVLVKAFLLRHVNSVAELEGLLLTRSDAARSWDASALARRLYITPRAASEVLEALHRHGLLSCDGEVFRYEPVSDALRSEVDALAAAYPRFLIPITNMIHSKPRAALREFADAFRLREEK